MTDQLNMQHMLLKAKIKFSSEVAAPGKLIEAGKTVLTIVYGYPDFFVNMIFDKDGNLEEIGAWE